MQITVAEIVLGITVLLNLAAIIIGFVVLLSDHQQLRGLIRTSARQACYLAELRKVGMLPASEFMIAPEIKYSLGGGKMKAEEHRGIVCDLSDCCRPYMYSIDIGGGKTINLCGGHFKP